MILERRYSDSGEGEETLELEKASSVVWRTPLILALGRLGRQIWVQAQPGLHRKHQASQGYMVRPCLRDEEVVRMRICCSLLFIASSFSSVWRCNSRPCRCQPSTSSLSYMPCCKSFVSHSHFKRYLLYVNMKYSASLRFYSCIYTNWSNSFDSPGK